jgi:predicted MFS family arabinose efflux permease
MRSVELETFKGERVATVENKRAVGRMYPWYVLGLLWFCGFFNYADRLAVNAVFPLIKDEFKVSDTQLGVLGMAFMVVYAGASPFAGTIVDLAPRRVLVTAGLAFWSLICAATGFARTFYQLLMYRAAEGLGESFYFPASLTILADYHPPETRSRALSIHQTSVYVGTAGGFALAGWLGELYGWRSPFFVLGAIGFVYSLWLWTQLVEPVRGDSEGKGRTSLDETEAAPARLGPEMVEVLRTPAAIMLVVVFVAANFVATAFMTWLTTFLKRKFDMGLTAASLASTAWPLASLPGALVGGYLADLAANRPGGRIRVQAVGLLCGAPFVFALGWVASFNLTVAILLAVGFCKGVYDANIWASLYDVVRPTVRGTASGLMNSVGWTGGFLAPLVVGYLSDNYGLTPAIASTGVLYVIAAVLAFWAAALAARSKPLASRMGSEW